MKTVITFNFSQPRVRKIISVNGEEMSNRAMDKYSLAEAIDKISVGTAFKQCYEWDSYDELRRILLRKLLRKNDEGLKVTGYQHLIQ